MKAGFWVAPEGDDRALTMLPIGFDEDERKGWTGTGTVSFLATAEAEEIIARCPQAAKLLPDIAAALDRQKADETGQLFDLTDLDAENKELIRQVLGEGEVSGVVSLTDGIIAQVQESVMPGLWRVQFENTAGQIVGEYLEVASIPAVVVKAAMLTAPVLHWGDVPEGAMNVRPVLAEIADRMAHYQPGQDNHALSFTQLPMTEVDMTFLQSVLKGGPVHLRSKGYGTCRVLATGARHVWSVQFFNTQDGIILDTLEIGDVPMAARAADEDFQDSAERLRDIYQAYFQ